jgi:hypothetical protein
MFVTSMFWSIFFGELGGAAFIVSLGSKLAVAFMTAEIFILRLNAETGKNPIADEAWMKQEYAGYKEAGLPIPPQEETYVLFKLRESQLRHKSQTHLLRWWFLTGSQKQELLGMMVAEGHQREENGDWDAIRVQYGYLKLFSDQRLLRDTSKFPAVMKMQGASAEQVASFEKSLAEAKAEASARKAKIDWAWSGKKVTA